MMKKFMRKCKLNHKEGINQEPWNENMKNISRECLVVSEETTKDRLTEITELLRLEHLSSQEETNNQNETCNWQPEQVSHPWRKVDSNKYITILNTYNGWTTYKYATIQIPANS